MTSKIYLSYVAFTKNADETGNKRTRSNTTKVILHAGRRVRYAGMQLVESLWFIIGEEGLLTRMNIIVSGVQNYQLPVNHYNKNDPRDRLWRRTFFFSSSTKVEYK